MPAPPHVNQQGSTWWRQVRRHLPWIAISLLGVAVGQWFVLQQQPWPIVSSDGSVYYLPDARSITSLQGLVDPKVPPGYPLLLAAIFALAGQNNLQAVVVVQAILLVAALIELYALMVIATVPRWIAAPVVGVLGASAWLAQWERYILGEVASIWAIVTFLLLTARFLRRPSTRLAVLCGCAGAAVPLLRPALVAVPAAVFVVLVARWLMIRTADQTRASLFAILVLAVVAYLPVGVYVAGNVLVNQCYCYTNIGNINLLGKIYEYGMQNLAPDPRYAAIDAQVRQYNSVNTFLAGHPEYKAQNYAPLGDFAKSQLLRYPGNTFRMTYREIRKIFTIRIDHAVLARHVYACRADPVLPYTLVTFDALQPSDRPYCSPKEVTVSQVGETSNRLIYDVVGVAYLLLPVALVLSLLVAWRRVVNEGAWLVAMAATVSIAVLIVSAVAGYEAFDRLRVPVDGVTVAALAIFVTQVARQSFRWAVAMVRSRRAGGTSAA